MKHIEILTDLFACQHLSDIHAQLDQVVRSALTTRPYSGKADARRLLDFQDMLKELIDAAFYVAGK